MRCDARLGWISSFILLLMKQNRVIEETSIRNLLLGTEAVSGDCVCTEIASEIVYAPCVCTSSLPSGL